MLPFVAFGLFLEILANVEAKGPRSVNLALETILAFNNKDKTADIQFLDNVQNFLEKVKTVVQRHPAPNQSPKVKNGKKNVKLSSSKSFEGNSYYELKSPFRRHLDERITFTDFIKRAVNILQTYEDDDLEDTFAVIDDEIRKYHYKGCKFYELVNNQDLRRFVAAQLNSIKDKPADVIRKGLHSVKQMIDDVKFDATKVELLDYVNSLYSIKESGKFEAALKNLDAYKIKSKRANTNLIKIVRRIIRSVIFDHYSKLNANARRDLQMRLEYFWKDLDRAKISDTYKWNLEINKNSAENRNKIPATLGKPVLKNDKVYDKTSCDETEKETLSNEQGTKYRHTDSDTSNDEKESDDLGIRGNKTAQNRDRYSKKPLVINPKSNKITKETKSTANRERHSQKSKLRENKGQSLYSHNYINKDEFNKPKDTKKSKYISMVTLFDEEINYITKKRRHKEKFTTKRIKELKSTKGKHSKHNSKKIRGITDMPYDDEENSEYLRSKLNDVKNNYTKQLAQMKLKNERSSVELTVGTEKRKRNKERHLNMQSQSDESTRKRGHKKKTKATTSIPSEEGLSIESYEVKTPTKGYQHYRKSFANLDNQDKNNFTNTQAFMRNLIGKLEREIMEAKKILPANDNNFNSGHSYVVNSKNVNSNTGNSNNIHSNSSYRLSNSFHEFVSTPNITTTILTPNISTTISTGTDSAKSSTAELVSISTSNSTNVLNATTAITTTTAVTTTVPTQSTISLKELETRKNFVKELSKAIRMARESRGQMTNFNKNNFPAIDEYMRPLDLNETLGIKFDDLFGVTKKKERNSTKKVKNARKSHPKNKKDKSDKSEDRDVKSNEIDDGDEDEEENNDTD